MFRINATIVLGAAAIAGCANNSGNTAAVCQELAPSSASPAPQWGGSVFTIVMENKGQKDIVGNAHAPFINELVKQNSLALGYHDSFVHPSEPNYIWMVAGENFGILDDAEPAAHHLDSRSHIADQLELAGLTWKTYQEGMGAPCGLTSHGRYAAKHNPFVYFDDINGWDGTAFQPSQRCIDHVVDYSQFDIDLANNALPKYAFITPNLDNDMHDASVGVGDAWLGTEVTKILGSKAFNDGGVLFLVWDEGAGGVSTGDDPPFIVISPNAKQGYVSKIDYDTSSYLKTVQTILGLAPLPCDPDPTAVATMDELFTVPLTNAQ